jgi:hypothetical protein
MEVYLSLLVLVKEHVNEVVGLVGYNSAQDRIK